ncbi:MAG TPA: carboxypeptidase regulatory-like domain-containing protein [Candidatus Sulfopaludibacter sp.]|jgi:hypothetical protein|nr:carboxypeptidase regulatory-like domain-containing protein [Candidatus Sulfopaludibacter sp.]
MGRFAILLLLSTTHLYAQTTTLHGQVNDESGAVIPGARVSVAGPAGLNRNTTADSSGAYSFAGLPQGDYAVQASAPELAQTAPAKVSLHGGTQTLNLVLRVASMVEKVTVRESAAPSLSTDSTNNASALVLRGDDLAALSDDPDDLAADLQALAGPSAGPNGGSIFIDGFSGGELPAKESIREIRINQNPFSPEYDKLGYGKIEIFTKPGSDKYHGTANWNFADQFWNSRNPYSARKAPFLLNEFEGDAGGPLSKRSSFTVDAQRNMVDNGSITNAVTVDRQTLAIVPYNNTITTPGRFTRVSPRVDYQLGEKHTLIFRYGITHSDVRDNGIGAFDLPARGYHSRFTNQTVQASDTALVGGAVNETRFQFFRSATQSVANTAGPTIQVLGSFNDGGAPVGQTFDTQNSYEFQNYTSMVKGRHSWRFGVRLREQTDDSVSPQNFNGTFTFGGGPDIQSIERYRLTLLYQGMGYSAAQIRALGGGATQFSMNAGTPSLSGRQFDAGIFAGDEWRVRPNLTLNLGIRYETQTNIGDRGDVAPRIALAWAPGATSKTPKAKTVVRAGFGMFYDRFGLGNTMTARRFNGLVQQQYVVTNPDFFPNVPSPASLGAFQSSQVIQEVSAHMRAPYVMQSALTLERQLPANTTLAVTYTNSHGLHLFRSEDINAPSTSPVFLMESSGLYNQNQVIANVNSKVNSGLSLFGFYVWNRARSNTDGIGTFPANPHDFSGEYGPAGTDVHHRFTLGGSVNLKWAVRISPFVVVQTGAPFDITAGSDLYGTTLFNGRPGFAVNPAKAGLIQTAYGLLDPNPTAGEALVPRNYGRGPGQISMNLRIAKVIGFGREKGGGGDSRPAASAGPGTAAAAGGGGMGRIIGTPTTAHRYNLSLGLSIRNLLNHTNAGPIIGNITSPLFGFANQVSGGANGEGFYETANNRRLESQIRFTF